MRTKSRKVLAVVGAVAICALSAAGLMFLARGGPSGPASDGLGMRALMGAPTRGACIPGYGSTKPFPTTGPLPLSASEKALSEEPAGIGQKDGSGTVSLANEDSDPVSVLFVGEDGRPRSKAFVRGQETAKVTLPSGAYDVVYETGEDWGAEGFGPCGKRGKVKGIVVAEPGLSSRVVLFGDAMFVLGNRLDQSVSARIEAEDASRRGKRNEGQGTAGDGRPGRSERSMGPEGI